MRLRVKNALKHKLGFVQPPYFYTPWHSAVKMAMKMTLTKWRTFSRSPGAW